VLVDQGTGSDTSSMPLVQVGNPPYSGAGPLKFANAEFAGLHVVCPNLDLTLENGSRVSIPAGASCQITATLVNTGEARWLPSAASKGGASLHTSAGDVALGSAVPALGRILMPAITITMGPGAINLTGRMRIQGVGEFGETLLLMLAVDSSAGGACGIQLSSASTIQATAAGGAGTVNVTSGAGCQWTATSLQPWVLVTPNTGIGTAPVTYTIASNTGPARQAIIAIAGHAFTVTQAAGNTDFVSPPSLSATSLDFGAQTLGASSSSQTVKLSNTASSALGLAQVAIGGPANADFSQSTTCGATLAPGASCSIAIAFTPLRAGNRAAALFVTANTGGGPLIIALSGSGIGTGPAPAIQAIADVWNYTPGVAPGLGVEIAGTNFAPFGVIADFGASRQLPTTLGGVSVTFNGVPAALAYAGPTQINALVPASVQPGAVEVAVEANGVTSSSYAVTAKATQPAIYALPNSAATIYYVTAALQGTGFLVGTSAVDSRVTRAVSPGDILDLYMIGLGATADPSAFVTSQEFSGAFPLSAQVTATVGGEAASVLFAGLTSPGLYLVRVAIPLDLKPGQQPIQISTGNPSAGGAQTSSLLALTIAAPGANLIQNGSFESALTGSWNFNVNTSQGAVATIQATTAASVTGNSSAQITVSSAAPDPANFAAVQLSQTGLSLAPGQIYRLMFWAKSDTPRVLHLDIAGVGNSLATSEAAVTSAWQQYVIYFQTTAAVAAAQLDFDFGDQTGNVWLDGVVLEGSRP